jgi:glycosyltransferase involved in cell wall biosynthesis
MTGLIAHEWIAPHGGAEEVLSQMMAAFPDARVSCLWNDNPGRFGATRLSQSWMSRTPLRRCKAAALPLMPATWRAVDTRDAEWVLTSSHAFAHHAGGRALREARRHFSYVHTPARYLWEPGLDRRGAGVLAAAVRGPLQRIDRARAREGSMYAANSEYVRQRLHRFWGVDAAVIPPPVRVKLITSRIDWRDELVGSERGVAERLPESFVLGASRFVSYKRLDLVIRAAEIVGLPAVIAGAGPEEAHLRAVAVSATVPVVFVISPSDELLFSLYQRAAVYVFPAVEDFGIMPVEAMSVGTPAVVNIAGGARESVEALDSGELADFDSPLSIERAVTAALRRDRHLVGRGAEHYSEASFRRTLRSWMGVDRAGAGADRSLGDRGVGSPDRDESALRRHAAVA